MAIKVTQPIYQKRKYYCPICDTEIKRNHKMHCGLEFDWSEVPKVNQLIRVTDVIRYDGLKTSVIAQKTNYDRHYVSHMLNGDEFMNDRILEYLVDELEVYIRKLKELKKELKRRI